MNTRYAAIAIIALTLVHCRRSPPQDGAANARSSSPVVATSTPHLTPTVQREPLPSGVTRAACDRTDSPSVFAPRTPAETAALLERLRQGPVAVRYHDCQIELLPKCSVAGTGEVTPAHSCCDTAMGCVGSPGVECAGKEERYWFGNEVEWLLNVPELRQRWSTSDAAALLVGALVQRQYRIARNQTLTTSCAEATHVIVAARFGSLRVEAESKREPGRPVQRSPLSTPASGETLVDVTLQSVGQSAGRAGEPCMKLAGARAGWEPASFQGETYVAPPARCTIQCTSGLLDCEKACRSGVRGACEADHLQSAPDVANLLDSACSAGFGAGCVDRGGTNRAQQAAVCEEGGDRSARVCGQLSQRTNDLQALEYAWRACTHGRLRCERFAELSRALGRTTDPRYEAALRFGCASGKGELCCELGAVRADEDASRAEGVQLLKEYCSQSVQACCQALRQRKIPVPSRRPRPD